MSIVMIMMLDAEDGVPKHSYSKKKQEERREKSCIVMLRTFQGRLLEAEKTGKKVSSRLSSLLFSTQIRFKAVLVQTQESDRDLWMMMGMI
jgi:hypothetical protein